MPHSETKYFGRVWYEAGDAIEFPAGLPGFENIHRYLPIADAARQPLIFLQSLEEPDLCFITLPIAAVEPGYRLKMSPEDMAAIGIEEPPLTGAGFSWLAIISLAPDGVPTANLLAPIVINPQNGRAVQSVRDDSAYDCRQPLVVTAGVTPCS